MFTISRIKRNVHQVLDLVSGLSYHHHHHCSSAKMAQTEDKMKMRVNRTMENLSKE